MKGLRLRVAHLVAITYSTWRRDTENSLQLYPPRLVRTGKIERVDTIWYCQFEFVGLLLKLVELVGWPANKKGLQAWIT